MKLLILGVLYFTLSSCSPVEDLGAVQGVVVGRVSGAAVYKIQDGDITCYVSYNRFDVQHAISCVVKGVR